MATQASIELVQEFYVTYFSRAGDSGGLKLWANRLSETDDLTEILAWFGSSSEFLDIYGQMTNDKLINNLYQQMFNRNADSEGLAFYTERLETGVATLEDIAKQIMDGIKGGNDSLIFSNKIIQAYCLTDEAEQGAYTHQSPPGEPFSGHDAILDSVGLVTPVCFPLAEITITGISGGEGDMFA